MAKGLLEILPKFFKCAELRVSGQRLIDPELGSIGAMFETSNLFSKTEDEGRDQALLAARVHPITIRQESSQSDANTDPSAALSLLRN